MNVVQTFGRYVDLLTDRDPAKGRWLLKTGWALQNYKFRYMPDKHLLPGEQYLADLMMQTMRWPLRDPEHSAIVSIFTPCEMLQEVGLHPYNAEAFSCYLEASFCGSSCLQQTENDGLSQTLCSYHRTFIGAAERGLMPKPKCIVYTNLTCDANLVTFQHLSDLYKVPTFAIDVPMGNSESDIDYVEQQMRDLKDFLEKSTGREISENALRHRVERSKRTIGKFDEALKLRSDKYIPNDLVSPLYSGMTNNILLGTKDEERFVDKLIEDASHAEPAHGIRIYWMHTIPFWSDAVKSYLKFNPEAQIVGDELQSAVDGDFDPSNPYRALATRMVNHALNGSVTRRIDRGIRNAKLTKADGVVWFNHWGCKHTIGGSQLARKRFEEAGIPCLILDGDGCDRTNGGEGQTLTRLGAFMEMLKSEKGMD